MDLLGRQQRDLVRQLHNAGFVHPLCLHTFLVGVIPSRLFLPRRRGDEYAQIAKYNL